MSYIEWLLVVALLIFLLYKWSQAKHEVLRHRGIPHEEPRSFVGKINFGLLLGRSSLARISIEKHMQFKDSKVYGGYLFHNPIIIIRDLDCIKKICVKDFDIFPNKPGIPKSDHDVLSKSLINLKDRQWKEMRNILSPSFTGSKMRLMFELVNECCIGAVNYLENELKAKGMKDLDLEMKDYFTRFTNDAIASTAFGIKINSFEDKTNDFYKLGGQVVKFNGKMLLKFLLMLTFPGISKFLRMTVLDKNKVNYFRQLVLAAIKQRQQHHIIRPDMIHLLLEAKKHHNESKSPLSTDDNHAQFEDEDLLAQCLLFFVAGFATVSACLCLTAHELLENPRIQEQLYEEIVETTRELKGKPLSYETLKKMKYMDMVLSESLRKWPPSVTTERICSKDYKLTDEEGNFVAEIKKGEQVQIPILAIHYDPAYFHDPEKFDPERFSEENKAQIKPSSFLSFGLGPRSCIGNRLALMETKAMLFHLLLKFKIERAEKTSHNLMDSMRGIQMEPKEGFWMKLVPRTN